MNLQFLDRRLEEEPGLLQLLLTLALEEISTPENRAHARRELVPCHPFELNRARALVADQRGAEMRSRLVAGVLGERCRLNRRDDGQVERLKRQGDVIEVEGHGSEWNRLVVEFAVAWHFQSLAGGRFDPDARSSVIRHG